ncbi:MAG TPA: hypothetical protein VFO03_10920 [Gaiellaceae bacterium]|nr:hypothetical protein [Gaiellaceae bacterium]
MVEIVFLMLVLKLPILYLVAVVWWAVRAEPEPAEPAVLLKPDSSEPPRWPRPSHGRRPRRGGPHGGGRSSRRRAGARAR